ncbi:hypothetical protein O7599_32160 [Streptomyces sp. WMMC500]|nr:hypothetical protein [Streptomyces sp. WMMC500]WBB60141.1 hypothetical protein O7599_32160 [Streptomyces sp. WMMC500]
MGQERLLIWRHVVDLERPWPALAADIGGLAEKIDQARSTRG